MNCAVCGKVIGYNTALGFRRDEGKPPLFAGVQIGEKHLCGSPSCVTLSTSRSTPPSGTTFGNCTRCGMLATTIHVSSRTCVYTRACDEAVAALETL